MSASPSGAVASGVSIASSAPDLAQDAVRFVIVRDPFNRRDAFIYDRDYEPGLSLADYIGDLSGKGSWAVSLNGGICPAGALGTFIPKAGDVVAMVPIPHGGGGGNGKMILRLAAVIALTVFTFGAGAFTLAGLSGLLPGNTLLATQIAVTVGGSLLINQLIPVGPEAPDTFEESNSYGLDGAKNTITEDVPFPVIYGEFRYGGNLIAVHTVNQGQVQQLNMLLNMGEGEIDSVSDIEVNDQALANFKDYRIETRLGTRPQSLISTFSDIISPVSVNLAVPNDEPVEWTAIRTTTKAIDRLRIDTVMPLGIGRSRSDGDFDPIDIEFEAQIRRQGETVWRRFSDYQATGIDPTHTYYSVPVYDAVADQYKDVPFEAQGKPITESGSNLLWSGNVVGTNVITASETPDGYLKISGRSRQPFRRSFWTPVLERGVYEVRFRKKQSYSEKIVSTLQITDINEVLLDDVAYNFTALLGLSIRVDDQLQGGLPKVTAKIRGRKVQVYNETSSTFEEKWDNNPAWICLDMITNSRFGGGLDISRVDLQAWREWAIYCDQKNLTFNGPIDTQMNLWDALAPVFRVGRAKPVPLGTRLSVAIEQPSEPVMMFSDANILRDSFGIEWLNDVDKANEVTVKFYNKDLGNKEDFVRVYDTVALERGDDPKGTEITLYGVDNADQATREGVLALNYQSLHKVVSFEAMTDAIACTVGSVVWVQHQAPAWGVAGRLIANASTTQLKLDRPVEMEAGKSYQVLIHFGQIKRFDVTVDSISGDWVKLAGYDASLGLRVRRLLLNGNDYEIVETRVEASQGDSVRLRDVSGIAALDAGTLEDTDVIESRDVVLDTSAPTDEIAVSSQILPAVPVDGAMFSFGEVGLVTQKFTVRRIGGRNMESRQIECLEYKEDVFDDTAIDLVEPPVPVSTILGPVTYEGVTESPFLEGQNFKTRITVEFSHPSFSFKEGQVWVNFGEGWVDYGRHQHAFHVDLEAGDEFRYKVGAVNTIGEVPEISLVQPFLYTVLGTDPPLVADPTGFGATPFMNFVDLAWSESDADPDQVVGYDALYEVWALSHTTWPNTADQIPENATRVQRSRLTSFTHNNLSPLTTYSYWLRAVHPNYPQTVRGNWVPSDTTGLVTTTLASSALTDILYPGGVDFSDLALAVSDELTALRVDVDLNAENWMDVAAQTDAKYDDALLEIGSEVTARQTAIDNLQGQITTLSGATAGAVFLESEEPVPGVGDIPDPIPANARWYDINDNNHPYLWDDVALVWVDIEDSRIASNDSRVTTLEATITDPITGLSTRASTSYVDSAVSTIYGADVIQFSEIDARFSSTDQAISNKASLTQLNQATADIYGAAVSAFTNIDARFSSTDSAISSKASLTQLDTAKADIYGAAVTAFTNINAEFANQQLDINSRATSQELTSAVADVYGAQVTAFTNINAAFSTRDLAINARATKTELDQAKVDILGATVSEFSEIQAKFVSVDAEVATRATVTQLNTAKSDIYGSTVSQFTNIDARFSSVEGDVANRATITQLNTAKSDIFGAAVTQFSQIDAKFTTVEGDVANRATVTTVNSVIADLDSVEAKYGVSLDVNGYVTGFTQNNNGQSGTFAVLADKFLVVNPTQSLNAPVPPFVVSGGTTYLRNVLVENAQIVNLDATKITAGTLDANRIAIDGISLIRNGNSLEIGTVNTGDLANSAVTNVKIASLDAAKITTGLLNATRVRIDGVTLTASGNTLVINSGGVGNLQLGSSAVSTTKIQANAVSLLGNYFASAETSTTSQAWRSAGSITVTTTGNPLRVNVSSLFRRVSGGDAQRIHIRVLRDTTDIGNSGTEEFRVDPANDFRCFAMNLQDQPSSGSHTYKIEYRSNNGALVGLSSRSITVQEVKR